MTLVELIFAMALTLLIMIFVLKMLDSGTRNERAQQARHTVQLKLRDAMTRVTKELRQASAVGTSSSTTLLDMQTLIGGTLTRVQYDRNGTNFRRTLCANTDLAAACGGTAEVLVTKFSTTTAPFCFDPPDCNAQAISTTPQTMRVTLSAEPEVFTGGFITMETDVDLRNNAGT